MHAHACTLELPLPSACSSLAQLAYKPQVFELPQIVARGMRMDLPHPTAAEGTVPQVACPIKLVGEELPTASAPPTLGAHTDTVLGEVLGMDAVAIGKLREARIIG